MFNFLTFTAVLGEGASVPRGNFYCRTAFSPLCTMPTLGFSLDVVREGIASLVRADQGAILSPMFLRTGLSRVRGGWLALVVAVWLTAPGWVRAGPADLPVFRPNDPLTRSGL